MIRSFRDLIAWQKGKRLAFQIYQSTKCLPQDERFGLTSQVRRAAVSVPANIAEGYGRGTKMDYLRFLRNARGSLFELMTHLELAAELDYMSDTDTLQLDCDETDRVLQGLIRSIENSNEH